MNKKLTLSLKVTGIALAVSQAFAPVAMAQEADPAVVVVKGLRASARSAVTIKKDAMEVVDSITADDIGKLPDPNVVDTLTRIPGVQGYRYGGEGASPAGAGSGVTIRGLSNQTSSHLNGRSYFTAGSREFNLEDAIPGMVAGLDVYKNPSAEHIEGGIGGLINVRTRNPSDFKKLTVSLGATETYNDLEGKARPELFGLIANRFDLGGGSRIGVMAAVAFQKGVNRADNTGVGRGPDYRRMIRGDSAEYATLAAANTSNDPTKALSTYVGRSDITFLGPVSVPGVTATNGANMPDTTGLTADQISNIISIATINPAVQIETIKRERKGLNLAADYRVSNTLRFYVEGNYTSYLYNQNYRFLNIGMGGNVRDIKLTPFTITEDLANRNYNGGSNDVLTTQRMASGTFMKSTATSFGGDEHSPFVTWTTATGVEWSPTPALSLKGDVAYINATRKQDNRRVEMVTANGVSWDVTRRADVYPHQLAFNGPDLSDPRNFVYSNYVTQTLQNWDDSGIAAAFDGTYSLDSGWFSRVKFGTRYAEQKSLYRNYASFGNRSLTTDGKPLAADQSNAINVASKSGYTESAPTNYMNGTAGYLGGFVQYQPDALLGNQINDQFPLSGKPLEGAAAEFLPSRRNIKEQTLAGYVSTDFSALNERLKGSVGVRVVRTKLTATAWIAETTGAVTTTTKTSSYTNALPSLNATFDLSKDFLLRFGYGKSLTRPVTGDLNPAYTADTSRGTAFQGNPDLAPQTANSFDLSLERYFSPTNYVAVAAFDKEIKGFFNDVAECRTLPTSIAPAWAGAANGCGGGQYLLTRRVNGESGSARGVEVSGQWFFDKEIPWLKNFGVSGSYTYVDTKNPINMGTQAAQRILVTPIGNVSKNSYTTSLIYEDTKVSARVAYTWRSSWALGAVGGQSPFGGSYVKAGGQVDAAFNYNIDEHMTLSLNGSNLTNTSTQRYVGQALSRETELQNQGFVNGRVFRVGLRYNY
ncbi:MAG: TonB-dependent receptor [Massilia sp.]